MTGVVAGECVRVGLALKFQSRPDFLTQRYRAFRDLRMLGEEMSAEREAKPLDFIAEFRLRQYVHGVLHRVGGYDEGIVRSRVRRREVAPEHHLYFHFVYAVPGAFAPHASDTNATFPVLMNAEFHEINGGAA
jgi:hypothetical protein